MRIKPGSPEDAMMEKRMGIRPGSPEDRRMEAGMSKNWIAGAIKHPGALHKQLGVPMGEKIPHEMMESAAEKGGTLGQRARLAMALSRMRGKT